jgi:hypothetical protein
MDEWQKAAWCLWPENGGQTALILAWRPWPLMIYGQNELENDLWSEWTWNLWHWQSIPVTCWHQMDRMWWINALQQRINLHFEQSSTDLVLRSLQVPNAFFKAIVNHSSKTFLRFPDGLRKGDFCDLGSASSSSRRISWFPAPINTMPPSKQIKDAMMPEDRRESAKTVSENWCFKPSLRNKIHLIQDYLNQCKTPSQV